MAVNESAIEGNRSGTGNGAIEMALHDAIPARTHGGDGDCNENGGAQWR